MIDNVFDEFINELDPFRNHKEYKQIIGDLNDFKFFINQRGYVSSPGKSSTGNRIGLNKGIKKFEDGTSKIIGEQDGNDEDNKLAALKRCKIWNFLRNGTQPNLAANLQISDRVNNGIFAVEQKISRSNIFRNYILRKILRWWLMCFFLILRL